MKSCISRSRFFLNVWKITAPNPVGVNPKFKIVAGRFLAAMFSFTLFSANAAYWYVDSSVGSSGDGKSWPTAWKNVSNISGVSPGDTVFISGGPSGSSQTYAISSWTPTGGNSGNPITYQIGQDTNHDGTATFTGSSYWVVGPFGFVIISGNAGDGQMHFALNGYSCALSSTGSGQSSTIHDSHFAYINFGNISGVNAININYPYNDEVDHIWVRMSSSGADVCIHPYNCSGGNSFGSSFKLHDSTIYVPGVSPNGGIGCDGVQCGGNGVSVYNNKFYAMVGAGGINHQDFVQAWGCSYVLVFNNYFYGSCESAVYPDNEAVNSSESNFYIFNNIIDTCQRGVDNVGDSTCPTVTSESCMNNLAVNGQVLGWGFRYTGAGSYVDCWVINNVDYANAGGDSIVGGVSQVDNVTLGSSPFVRYTAGSTNNDYHLTAAATSLIGKGTNLTAWIAAHSGSEMLAYDMDGNPRPTTGAWDIGPYEYNTNNGSGGGGGSSNNPVISISSTSINFGMVLTNTSTNQVIIVQNTGSGPLTGSTSVSAPFQIVSGGNYNLGSNQTQTVTIGFNPTTTGAFTQTVIFTVTNGNSASANVTGLAYGMQPVLSFGASAGTIVTPFTVSSMTPITVAGTTVSGYISQASTTELSGSGVAVYGFSITNAGSYVISAIVNAPSTAADSFYVNIDGPPTDPTMIWDPPVTSGFTNLLISWRGNGTDTNNEFVPEVFDLSAGTHQLIICGREAGTQLASMSIMPYAAAPAAPTGLRVVSP